MDKKRAKTTRAKRTPARTRSRCAYPVHFCPGGDPTEDDFASMLYNHMMMSQLNQNVQRPRRVSRRSSCGRVSRAKKQTPAQPPKAGLVVELSDSEDEQNTNPTSALVKNRVSQFFKDNNLVSDDDDVIPVGEVDVNSTKSSTIVKPDSDTDGAKRDKSVPDSSGASTSGYSWFVPPVMTDEEFYSTPSANLRDDAHASGDKTTSKKNDEKADDIMAYVDAILVDDLDSSNTKAPDPLADARSFEQFRQETEDMLKNVSNMLDTFKGVKPKEPETPKVQPPPPRPQQESPKSGLGNCPVCLEPMIKDICSTSCGHVFCKSCITKVAKSHKKCPTCRKPINTKTIHPLFIGV